MGLKFNRELYNNKRISRNFKSLKDIIAEVKLIQRYLETEWEGCSLESTSIVDRALERLYQMIVDGAVNIVNDYVIFVPEKDEEIRNPFRNEVFNFVQDIISEDISDKFITEFMDTRNNIVHLQNLMDIQFILEDIDTLISYTVILQENLCLAAPCPSCGSVIRVKEKVRIGAKLFCEDCCVYCRVVQDSPLLLSPDLEYD